MKISLIYPSRGRAAKSFITHADWISKAHGADIETIVAVDHTDPTRDQYIAMYAGMCYVGHHDNVVAAANAAASRATGDILLYLSDDFKAPDNWPALLIEQFQGKSEPMLLKVHDDLQNFGACVLTIPIVNRSFYDKLKYFFHPGYKSMFCDEDLYWTAKKLNALKLAPQLVFPHEHVCNGKAPDDETYRRSSANWNQGQEFFKQRKAAGFPI